ncbi:MAG: hypothetical protein SCALA702_31430 [Melioribacteraceae bacterium]|nr:MAG: hypothetical protein SCALA702_31430 [Melioribacteraceae bacterium]
MNNFFKVFFILVVVAGLSFGQLFQRVAEISLPSGESSFGNMISGVDLDGDGQKEIYAVNNNWNDGLPPGELIPKIYKYEFNNVTDEIELVWSAIADIPLQNTWPALTVGDLDQDGKMEVIWGPVNFTGSSNPNPSRIMVWEVAGDGSDVLGVSDGAGGYTANAEWTITDNDDENHRPFRWFVTDIDNDDTNELVMCTRAGDLRYAVVSVSDVPDNGDDSEEWTLEASDLGNGAVTGNTTYDMAIMNNTIYLLHNSGDVTPITNDGTAYTVEPILTGLTLGSWNSATVVDIDENGVDEMLVASWSSTGQNIYLLQGDGATLTSTVIADVSGLVSAFGRLYGGAAGDIDNNGMLDYVVGSRDALPNAAIVRVEYLGGDITQSSNYQATVIDQEFAAAGGRWMHINVADIDTDPNLEILYSEGTGEQAPIVVIDKDGMLPVELSSFTASIKDGYVNLDWETATEINNLGFEVERKAEGSEFKTIGFVDGHGTTTEAQNYSFVDENRTFGQYTYRLKQVDQDGQYTYSNELEVDFSVPVEFNLTQNYPNPFNPTTTIQFGIPEDASVSLRVYNMLGEEVAVLLNNELLSAGTHTAQFNASALSSGTYVYSLVAGNNVVSKKMTVLK